jgi:hypothetical protein
MQEIYLYGVHDSCRAYPASYQMGVSGVLSPGVKRPKRKADSKNAWSCTFHLASVFMA